MQSNKYNYLNILNAVRHVIGGNQRGNRGSEEVGQCMKYYAVIDTNVLVSAMLKSPRAGRHTALLHDHLVEHHVL